jgi:hypothetical protein
VFTHTKLLKTSDSKQIPGNLVKQFINPRSGELIPDPETFTYVSAVESKLLVDFKNLKIIQDYGISSFQDAVLFRLIEDIKIVKELQKIKENDEVL